MSTVLRVVILLLAFAPAAGAATFGGYDVPAVDLPTASLTPGAVFPNATAAQVCVPGYSASVRDVSDSDKALVYARYHVRWVSGQHEVDHLISLELGGSNDIANLWPEPYAGRWNARVKDTLENRLHDLVCNGSMPLRTAQLLISRAWPLAYLRYIGSAPGGSVTVTASAGSSAGGYYASSYPTAHTIYCASSSGWKSLSPTYLQHFATLAAAQAAHPGFALESGC